MAPVFDGHNDLLFRLWLKKSATAVSDFIDGEAKGQLDLPRMHDGGFAGGFFAMFVPSEIEGALHESLNPPPYAAVGQARAQGITAEMVALFHQLAEEVPNHGFRPCLSVADIRAAMHDGAIAAILHLEGAEAIGPDLAGLDELYDAGLRSLGPVWSRPNVFGAGVPFAWPSSPDTGPGLTEAGRALVSACNAKRIMIDLSHINEKGFWDVARLSSAPLVATHSNAHALSPSSRNLTDAQLRAIGESKGMVGLNYAVDFLQDDGVRHSAIAPEVLIRHLEHMIKLAGEDCVGLGSDFDGATVPDFLGDVAGLPKLVDAMEKAGFGEKLIAKITHENWLRVLGETWG
ncbi:MAG: dipeptidase [Alphaproteobacteria bacterium]|nr:dipeptidase [Alphaproteobacteria bacterium]